MDDESLDDLTWHWGSAYAISQPARDRWLAQRRDDRSTLVAASADELRDLILADYKRCPVPRDHGQPQQD